MNKRVNTKVLVFYLIGLMLLTVLTTRCIQSKQITEATIVYTITYPDFSSEEHPFLNAFLPKQQVVYIKDGKLHTQIKKSVFELNVISDEYERSFYSEYLFNEWFHFLAEGDGSKELVQSLPDYELIPTNERKEILGYETSKIIAKSNEGVEFELWVMGQTNLRNPYWYTPYNGVDGLLLEYGMVQNGVRMEFLATSFVQEVTDESAFKVEKKGRLKSFADFSEGLNELFEKLTN